MDIWRTI